MHSSTCLRVALHVTKYGNVKLKIARLRFANETRLTEPNKSKKQRTATFDMQHPPVHPHRTPTVRPQDDNGGEPASARPPPPP